MQNYCKTIGALAAASALVAGNASAMDLEYALTAGYNSEYIWRGLDLGNDQVEVAIDAATEINGFGLSVGAWYTTAQLNAGPFTNTYDELDLYGEVNYDFGFATAAVGYIWYYFPEFGGSLAEVPISLRRDFGFIEADLTYFWDVKGDNDGYTQLTLSNATELNSCLTLSSALALGYLAEKGELAHVTASVALDYALTETATVSPYIAHSWALTEKSYYVGSKNQLFGGVRVSVSF